MKNKLFNAVAFVIIWVLAFGMCGCANYNSRVSNDVAEKDSKGRYLTIINDTKQIINKVYVVVGEGTEIEGMEQTNPDETSFSIEIPKAYSDYTTFTVILIDRYDLKYTKEVNNVAITGRTEVKISEEDYVKEADDFWDKLDKFFNGD